MAFIPLLLTTVVLCGSEGCFRSSAPKPVRKTDEIPRMDATGIHPSHKEDCRDEEVLNQGCLNGGTCFAIRTENSRQLACMCTEEFTGSRCHLVYVDPRLYEVRQENLRTANLAAGASVCIMLAFIIIFAVWVYFRYRRKERCLGEEQHVRTQSLPSNNQPFTARSTGTARSNGQTDTCEVDVDQNRRGSENCPTTETALLDSDMKESRL
ncbi:hypothetical protein NP493_370g06057 [Ridgeia piscesae]|uniref:EGF-like domain-containing protein n=1 Tax=Ridgeia piscesae TaxID=27915 RepID=A0AAD9L294_RIDPI|nr:hypothetical protein NP493_370g06057 [Ridgeia piscesae]